jgi:hypothetical protein
VSSFVASAAAVWFLIAPFEATLGWLGSIGWASFAIGWVRAVETDEDMVGAAARRIDLMPRHRTSTLPRITLGIAVAGSLCALALAWNAEGRERALLAQGVAVVGALSLVTAASASAEVVGRQAAARKLSTAQIGRSLILAGLLVFGCWLTFFRT